HQIEQHEIPSAIAELDQPLVTRMRHPGLVALKLQLQLQHPRDILLVLHNQDPFCHDVRLLLLLPITMIGMDFGVKGGRAQSLQAAEGVRLTAFLPKRVHLALRWYTEDNEFSEEGFG